MIKRIIVFLFLINNLLFGQFLVGHISKNAQGVSMGVPYKNHIIGLRYYYKTQPYPSGYQKITKIPDNLPYSFKHDKTYSIAPFIIKPFQLDRKGEFFILAKLFAGPQLILRRQYYNFIQAYKPVQKISFDYGAGLDMVLFNILIIGGELSSHQFSLSIGMFFL